MTLYFGEICPSQMKCQMGYAGKRVWYDNVDIFSAADPREQKHPCSLQPAAAVTCPDHLLPFVFLMEWRITCPLTSPAGPNQATSGHAGK